jgi:hypothetical protein
MTVHLGMRNAQNAPLHAAYMLIMLMIMLMMMTMSAVHLAKGDSWCWPFGDPVITDPAI